MFCCVYVCVPYASWCPWKSGKGVASLKLELETNMSCCVGAEVKPKSSGRTGQCS